MGNQHWNRRSCHALLSHLFSQLFSILKYIDKKCYVTKPLVRNICKSDIHLNHLGLLYIVWTLKKLFGENQHFLIFSLLWDSWSLPHALCSDVEVLKHYSTFPAVHTLQHWLQWFKMWINPFFKYLWTCFHEECVVDTKKPLQLS